MNQILLTKKLYITPELKRKQALYKFFFFLCIFLVGVLFSFYIYGMYEQNANENLSQEIFASVATKHSPEEVLVVYLDEEEYSEEEPTVEVIEPEYVPLLSTYTASNGKEYDIVGLIQIPSIELQYPILADTSDALLKVSVCKYKGPEPNTEGNLCIAGHNYTNTRAFSKLVNVSLGDIIEITDLSGKTCYYKIYKHYIVSPYDLSCTNQDTDGKKEVTLITCTNGTSQRRIVKATELSEEETIEYKKQQTEIKEEV